MGIIGNFMQRWRRNGESKDFDKTIPNNPSGKEFLDSARNSIRKTVDKYSITANSIALGNMNDGSGRVGTPFGAAGIVNPGSEIDLSFSNSTLGLALPVDTNKVSRIQSYDNIARYPELDWCINEIANDFLHEDDEHDYVKLLIKTDKGKYSDGADEVLKEEFRHIVSNFDLRTNGYNMIRKFLIEGELCFENVIDPNHSEYGILGEKYLPNVFYDFLRDQRTGQMCGIFIDPERIKTYAQFSAFGGASNSYSGQSTTVFNAVRQLPAYSYTYSQNLDNKIIMPFEQVTYMNSGVLSEDGSIVFPHIEKVVTPVRQLLLLHDAMVILRITRAPEKLMFNIDMTGFQPKEAKNFVRKFAEQRKSKKAVIGSGTLTNVYNAETMLDAYYFWKTSEAQGATVTNLNTNTAHYNELNDVEYFLHRILKFMNIPWQRWQENAANRQDKQSIVNEEYSFSQMIVRFQSLFAAALKKTFITHLRLRGLFDKFDVLESDFEVVMTPPSIFEIYQAQTKLNDRLDILAKISSIEFLSKNLMLKRVFGWTDSEIKDNEVNVRRELLIKAQNDFSSQQVAAAGTPTAGKVWLDPEKYVNPPTPPNGTDANGGAPMPPPGGMPPGGAPNGAPDMGGGMPPDMGGGAAAPSTDMGGASMDASQVGGAPDMSGGMPQVGGMSPDMGGAAAPSPDIGGAAPQGSAPLNIPEPKVPEPIDDSGTTAAEKALQQNPSFGDYEELSRTKNVDFKKRYPESDERMKALNNNVDLSLKNIFDKVLGSELDSKKSLAEIFADEFGTENKSTRKKYVKSLKSVFDKTLGTKEPASDKSMTNTFKDVFIRNKR